MSTDRGRLEITELAAGLSPDARAFLVWLVDFSGGLPISEEALERALEECCEKKLMTKRCRHPGRMRWDETPLGYAVAAELDGGYE